MIICYFFSLFLLLSGCIEEEQHQTENSIIVNSDGSTAYSSIQQAIDDAKENDTIQVNNGIYREHLMINKTVHLAGDNPSFTIIDGNHSGSVISINADHVTITGFTVRNSGTKSTYYEMDAGINIESNNTNVTNCICDNNTVGLQIKNTELNKVDNNILTNNSYGLFVYYATDNTISNNTIKSNGAYGCYLYSSSNDNTVMDNIFLKNRYALRIKAEYNYVVRNLFQDNEGGIYFCCGARNNMVYHNTVINNTDWNGKANFKGNQWFKNMSVGGNYWSDYNGTDIDGDGFGDAPYVVDKINYKGEEVIAKDIYPLMIPVIESH